MAGALVGAVINAAGNYAAQEQGQRVRNKAQKKAEQRQAQLMRSSSVEAEKLPDISQKLAQQQRQLSVFGFGQTGVSQSAGQNTLLGGG